MSQPPVRPGIVNALLAIAFAVVILLVFLAPRPAHAQDSTVDGNYAMAVQAATALQAAQLEVLKAKADALPGALSACARFTGELAQAICAMSATGVIGGGQVAAIASTSAGVTLPAPPPPQKEANTIYQLLANAPSALFEGLVRIAPAGFQYLLGKVQANAQVQVAGYQAQRDGAMFNMLGTMHGQTVGGMQAIANQGFITFGALPPAYNVSGSGNVNIGSGTLTFNPVTSSYNPVTNPAPRVCSGTPLVCS